MKIVKLLGEINLLSGLHIGGGDDTMKIGGIDNGVIKDVNSDKPYIPGSSLKGKMRSLLEWNCGVVNLQRNSADESGKPLTSKHIFKDDGSFYDPAYSDKLLLLQAETLLKLFGDKEGKFGITRISVGDCSLIEDEKQVISEAKYENVIDRQKGTAQHPRQTERVPAGVSFRYDIRLKILDSSEEELLKAMVKQGMELVENDYLGGNGSRGYGRVLFSNKSEWVE
ncbi:MAG: type III-A CRISPR-associated RAMP protein Csm3 [Epsilonproteobacteria bacterium]|nr:type III-A CRISPR-associated RAMP protein Csm3 [Campylobacterota bacterium]